MRIRCSTASTSARSASAAILRRAAPGVGRVQDQLLSRSMSEAPNNAVITGAASGIGLGLAREAARRGMRLVLADRDADALAAAADALPDALAVPTDVTDPAAVERLAAAAYDRLGPVDLLFNNAGIMATGFSWEIDPARWDASLKVNIGGVLNGIRAFVPRMLQAARPARIVNTASVGGFNPSPLMAPYSATNSRSSP
ncbi:SDR family NAD(P)-dependent oxidoreductase [Rhizorhabdus histidinilytica]